jgi:hypothetical protein
LNTAHIHLLLNTTPPIATVTALMVLAAGVISRNSTVKRVAMAILVAAAVMAIPVYLTGKEAVMVIRERPNTSLISIGDHHESAMRALIALEVAGLSGVWGIFGFRRRELPRWYSGIVLLLGVTATVLLIRTAYIGGHIAHPETLPGFTVPDR